MHEIMGRIWTNYASRFKILMAILLLLPSCGNKLDSDTFFNFPISEIRDSKTETALEIPFIDNPGGRLVDCVIKDSLLFSFSNTDNGYAYYVSSINSGELVGQLFKRGRAGNEPLWVMPIWDLYEEDGNTKGLMFAYHDARLFVCDITSSLSSGHDKYDRVVKLEWEGEGLMPLLFYFHVSDSTMIGYNTGFAESNIHMEKPPIFEVYNTYTGKLLKKYELFNMIDYESDSFDYTSANYLYNYCDIKPDRSKLVFCMAYISQINVMDIATGETKGFKIKGHEDFTTKGRVRHFTATQCDDKYIYALYSDKESESMFSDILYVFDWNGNVKRKYRLDNSFTRLCLDGDMLYLCYGDSDKLYGISTTSLIK